MMPEGSIHEVILKDEDFSSFRSWINLNLGALTWQGRYEKEFEEFWVTFFVSGLSIEQVFNRFRFALNEITIGPLVSWFSWLRERFIAYIFINQNVSLGELSAISGIGIGEVANILRNFFIDQVPQWDEQLTHFFQIGNIASGNVHLSFKILAEKIDLKKEHFEGSDDHEIMPSMEVTLYPEWNKFLKTIKTKLVNPSLDYRRLRAQRSLGKQFSFIKDVVGLIVVGLILVYGIRYANQMLEEEYSKKVSIYEPQFKWLDKSLKFKDRRINENAAKLKLEVKDIETVETFEESDDFFKEERFETESEVALTSWDELPKDFDVADLEQSSYEELKNKGYRESRYGNTKVFRVLMRSEDIRGIKEKLNGLLEKYSVVQVDNVVPGKVVPGGIYYNLFVDRNYLKEFLAQTMDGGESILYESKTQAGRNPPGKNRVFIWVKSI